MGYTTDFDGEFTVTPALKPEHEAYLKAFNATRRMKRSNIKALRLPDHARDAVELPIGSEGAYFVGAEGAFGQDSDESILDYNSPPQGQPGLWCQWTPTSPTTIGWDEGEKFYEYESWIAYLIEHFLAPWGYVLNGEVDWYGEDRDDIGRIVVVDNVITIKLGTVTYPE